MDGELYAITVLEARPVVEYGYSTVYARTAEDEDELRKGLCVAVEAQLQRCGITGTTAARLTRRGDRLTLVHVHAALRGEDSEDEPFVDTLVSQHLRELSDRLDGAAAGDVEAVELGSVASKVVRATSTCVLVNPLSASAGWWPHSCSSLAECGFARAGWESAFHAAD